MRGFIENYTIRFDKSNEGDRSYSVTAIVNPKTKFESVLFGDEDAPEITVYQRGVIEYDRELPKHSYLYVDIPDNYIPPVSDLRTIVAYPVPKVMIDDDVDITEPSSVKQVLTETDIPNKRKEIKSHDGMSSITISDNGIVLKSGNTSFEVGTDGFYKSGKTHEYSLPNKNTVLFQESEFRGILPHAFLPGFNIPRMLPSGKFFNRITNITSSVSKLNKFKRLLKEL